MEELSFTIAGNEIGAGNISAVKNPMPLQPEVFGNVPENPTLEAIEGITFDFCDGIRVKFPESGEYRCRFLDIDSGMVLYNMDVPKGAYVSSVKKFFIRFRLEIFRRGEAEPIFIHDYDATARDVLIQLPVGTLGDSIAWFSYVERFQIKHKCRLICAMTPYIADLVRNQYPDIVFITKEETEKYRPYACYRIGLYFRGDTDHQPVDFRYAGLHRTAANILGVDTADMPPRFDLSAPRKIAEPYVVIATQASAQAKYWNNPIGWREVIRFLHSAGYRVLCIDKEPVHGAGIIYNQLPNGAEDVTGDLPLQERVDLIKDATCFIGVSSGLSWVAWGCKVPVVLVSGFTSADNEFATPYRVINYHVCNSCWNDMRIEFDHFDFLWCPRLKNTPRQFECTRLLPAQQVIETIKKIPCFSYSGNSPTYKTNKRI